MGISFLLVQIIGLVVGFTTKAERNQGSWNNDVFIDQRFWAASPTSENIVSAVYGNDINDTTAYTKDRS